MEWGSWLCKYRAEEEKLNEDRGCWEQAAPMPFPKAEIVEPVTYTGDDAVEYVLGQVEPLLDQEPCSIEKVIAGWIYRVMELFGW